MLKKLEIVIYLALLLGACTDEQRLNVSQIAQKEVFACSEFSEAELNALDFDRMFVIRDISVVEDYCRTQWNNPGTNCEGKWTLWHLMSQMAGSGNPSTFILNWLESYEKNDIIVNGYTLTQRNRIRSEIIDPWRAASGCATGSSPCNLDKKRAPFRLLAIVNRMDLRGGNPYGEGSAAGEVRFVFGFTSQMGAVKNATVILEYRVPTAFKLPIFWGYQWQDINYLSIGNPSFNSALQELTEEIVSAGASPGSPNNGSAISRVRTNERQFDPAATISSQRWSLREFVLGCPSGMTCALNALFLVPKTVMQTPNNSWNETPELVNYVNANAASIMAEQHSVPISFLGGESLSLPIFSQGGQAFIWNGESMYGQDERRLFAFSTCNGCHYWEAETSNFHVAPRARGVMSDLSGFLEGNHMLQNQYYEGSTDLVEFNEPRRRKCEFLWMMNFGDEPLTAGSGRPH